MWPSIRRWRDWAMRDLWFLPRTGPRPLALHYGYEKAGLSLRDQPVPWNAEAVLIEAEVGLPSGLSRRKADFQVWVGGQPPVTAESMRRQEGDESYRLLFRLAPPARTTGADLRWRGHRICQLTLPIVGRQEFLDRLRLELPTLFVRLGEQNVACQTFVSTQCRGLTACAVLSGPTSLVPLLDLGLEVEFRSERGGPAHSVAARLCGSQLADRQALVTLAPRGFPRRIGTWTATWKAGDRVLSTHRIRAISQRHFQRSLRVCGTRFVIHGGKGNVSLTHQAPALDACTRIGPCFLINSREPGMAGICSFQVRAQVAGAVHPPLLQEQEYLITDGPTVVAPGTLHVGDLAQVAAFELRVRGESLGVLPLSPVPSATFTAEGGFRPAPEFTWSGAADEELSERMGRLMDGR